MCTACNLPTLKDIRADQFAERLLGALNDSSLVVMVGIGHRTGLFDTMKDLPPSTSLEIAEAAGLNERYVREWLGAMVTGRVVAYQPEGKLYHLPEAHAACLTREAAPNNLAAFAQYLGLFGTIEDRIIECFEKGGGVPYSAYPRFQTVMAEDSGQTVLPALLEHIIPLDPGLTEKLERGIEVLDVGFGMGKALNLMAKRFPNSRFTGYEISREGVLGAQAEADANGLTNVQFVLQDAATFKDEEAFDLIFTFDAVHDQADPGALLRNIYRALRPGGLYLMQDIDTQTNLEGNLEHPMGTFIYTVSCLHCMTVSLAEGGAGLGAAWGEQLALEMLEATGFRDIEVHRLPHDVQNAYYLNRK